MGIKIDGKLVSAKIREQIGAQTALLAEQGIVPGLAVVLVGEDAASQVYVRGKHKACLEVGFYSKQHVLPADTTQESLLELVAELAQDDRIHGILVQLPLLAHINEQAVIDAIPPHKDVDAFHPYNVGRIVTGDYQFLPCTPAGVISLLEHYEIDLQGKHCVVVGRSNIVGKPMALLLLHKHATVSICHSRTENLAEHTRQADVLVAAVGKANFITGEMVKEGAVVIDVGMNRLENGKLCGDVDFAEVEPIASYITPVPGGVGPMTITTLLENTLHAAQKQAKK